MSFANILRIGCTALVVAVVALGAPITAHAGGLGPPPLSDTVGIRVTVSDLRPSLLEADFDLTMYTRYPTAYPSYPAGTPYFGIPALDYGDGSTISTTPLALASSGGGPNGSNVYRSLTSFSHSYPAPGNYTVTAGMFCTACIRVDLSYFPAGSPGTPSYTLDLDYVPTSVIGNLAATYNYTGTTLSPFFSSYSVRYMVTLYGAVTNTTQVAFAITDIPTTSEWGLIGLAVLLMTAGVVWLRRL